jgi:copper ion binding protein
MLEFHQAKGSIVTETVYSVSGMTCEHCAQAVTRAVTGIPGVHDVAVDVTAGKVAVHSDAALPVEGVRAAIEDAGYELVSA